MRRLILVILLTLSLLSCSDSKYLYQSEHFTIGPNAVKQGRYSAVATADTSLRSNYVSSFKKPTSRILNFKFALNGNDNERYPGEDHHLFLESQNGEQVSPIYTFGAADPPNAIIIDSMRSRYLDEDINLTIRVNMNQVLEAFKNDGYYTLYNGDHFRADDFEGLYIAGNTLPLSWDFANLPGKSEFKLTDPDGDGIYTISLMVQQFQQAENSNKNQTWTLQQDISNYPEYRSEYVISDALYKMSLEELILDIREDRTFMAGAKWPGVWTRDISYSILLSLAIIEPEVARRSLMHKVQNQRIIQDTGTGGSWPVSTDRMTWALAAWEIYTVSGDTVWLRESFEIIKNTAEDDLLTTVNSNTGLFYGESSFLDWREQSYPRWMDSKDIYMSQCLGTNAVHYQTYRILSMMALNLGQIDLANKYNNIAETIKLSMNKWLWDNQKHYYGQYLYGRNYFSLSPRSETLGEALCILFDIADTNQKSMIISNTPITSFGTPCFYPQIPDMSAYHNNSIWPFVEAYWAWAAAKTGNSASVEHSIAAIYRPAALFLTNKENMVAETGDYMGTEINSDRQLWSIAGNLAIIYRIFFGLDFQPDEINFNPFIPQNYTGIRSLNNFHYRDSQLDITIEGFGNTISKFYLDNILINEHRVPANLSGNHTIHIIMNNQMDQGSITEKVIVYTPDTPIAEIKDHSISWSLVQSADHYLIYQNGKPVVSTRQRSFSINPIDFYSEYQVLAVDKNGYESFLSEPVSVTNSQNTIFIKPEDGIGMNETDFLILTQSQNRQVKYLFSVSKPGTYTIDFRYSNGNGPINTNNRCAIRSVFLDDRYIGVAVFPQRGDQNWSDWGFSNSIHIDLKAGDHNIILEYLVHNANMNRETNAARLDFMRLITLPGN